jgi:hypothetical protein
MELPFILETPLERSIAADPEWQAGVVWGVPRAGHLEGPVMYHIADVLANIDRACPATTDRRMLRLIALLHDTFKYKVDEHKPRVGKNHHAHIARVFAERYISDPVLLDIIELHDVAYHCWRLGHHRQQWQKAEEGIDQLIARLGDAFPLYVRFFFADSDTESKNPAPMHWLTEVLRHREIAVPIC